MGSSPGGWCVGNHDRDEDHSWSWTTRNQPHRTSTPSRLCRNMIPSSWRPGLVACPQRKTPSCSFCSMGSSPTIATRRDGGLVRTEFVQFRYFEIKNPHRDVSTQLRGTADGPPAHVVVVVVVVVVVGHIPPPPVSSRCSCSPRL